MLYCADAPLEGAVVVALATGAKAQQAEEGKDAGALFVVILHALFGL